MVFLVVAMVIVISIGTLLVQCGVSMLRLAIFFALLPIAVIVTVATDHYGAPVALTAGAAWIVAAWFVSGLRAA